MTKKEKQKEINKAVFEFAATLGYEILDEDGAGRITFSKPSNMDWHETIEYHKSRHNACTMDFTSHEVKTDCELINIYAKHKQSLVCDTAL